LHAKEKGRGQKTGLFSSKRVRLFEEYAVLTKVDQSRSADPGEWDNLFPAELAGLPNIPTAINLSHSAWTSSALVIVLEPPRKRKGQAGEYGSPGGPGKQQKVSC
jgi:hypothetical protein